MDDEWNTTNILSCITIVMATVYLIKYNWERRYLYYYAARIPGPFSLPFAGCVHILYPDRKDFFRGLMKIVRMYSPVGKAWLGTRLCLFSSRPQDIEPILNNCLKKSVFYRFFNAQTRNSILVAPVSLWKVQRKIINHSFSTTIINSYFDCFTKCAKDLVQTLATNSENEETDITSKIWNTKLLIVTETLLDINPASLDGLQDSIWWSTRTQQLIIERVPRVWLHLDFLWKLSSLGRECQSIEKKIQALVERALKIKVSQMSKIDDTKRKHFLNYLFERNVPLDQMIEESCLMYAAATGTTATAMAYVVLCLGIYPDIQEKVYREQVSIFENDDGDPTLKNLSEMNYLERVIKESMRLFPPVPIMLRSLDRDIYSEPYVFPAGGEVVIPIIHVHRDPELWPDPLKFDPDRFLPEEVKKRHRCSYIPFSFGARNCIGWQFAMTSMKIIMSAIVRSFKIETLNWKSVEDIEYDFQVTLKPKNYKLIMHRRK